MTLDPGLIALIGGLLAANSGLWRVLDRWLTKRYPVAPKCGSEACNNAVRSEMEKELTCLGSADRTE